MCLNSRMPHSMLSVSNQSQKSVFFDVEVEVFFVSLAIRQQCLYGFCKKNAKKCFFTPYMSLFKFLK